jgi:hypothetical protein
MTRVSMIVAGMLMLSGMAAAAGPYQGPIQGPIQAPTKAMATALPICCDRDVAYRHHHPRTEPCGARHEAVLLVKDPCACCLVQVPVCLPCCCQGEPEVCSHKGVLCRDVTEFTWCSGYRVRVVIDRHGCVVVHYNV